MTLTGIVDFGRKHGVELIVCLGSAILLLAFLIGLTDFLYQRDREIIASARPDPAVG